MEHQYQVGVIPETGWVLNLSVIATDVLEALRRVVPILIKYEVPFRVPERESDVNYFISGRYGANNIAKIICIFPEDDVQAAAIAAELVTATEGIRGPRIPGGAFLGGVVYASVENFTKETQAPPATEGDDTFRLPGNVTWPFETIAKVPAVKRSNRITSRYVNFGILKNDPKGKVIRAIRRKHFFDFKLVVIKCGAMYTCSNSVGDDIRSRLRWQQRVYKEIKSKENMAKVHEYFELDGDGYLVMDYVKGVPLSDIISAQFQQRPWVAFSIEQQVTFLRRLIVIFEIVKRFHAQGFVHRDLTCQNFMVRRNKIWILDLELVYSLKDGYPSQPYGIGTEGYMSPEQRNSNIPTIKEDIYALGAILQKTLTGIDAYRLASNSRDVQQSRMFFFIQDAPMAGIIADCLNQDPDLRPELDKVRQGVVDYSIRLKAGPAAAVWSRPDNTEIGDIISGAIRSLGKYFPDSGYWVSKDEHIALAPYEGGKFYIYGGLSFGVMGIGILVARARNAGYDVSSCMDILEKNLQVVSESYIEQSSLIEPGLGQGMAGVATGMVALKNEGILPSAISISAILPKCFVLKAAPLDIAMGLAGQGIGALIAETISQEPGLVLPEILQTILEGQKPRGDWDFFVKEGESSRLPFPGLMNGTAGVIYFLLEYWHKKGDKAALAAGEKAMAFLMNDFRLVNGELKNHKEVPHVLYHGLSGIALTFIRAYELLGTEAYRGLAEKLLLQIPEKSVFNNFTTYYGLTGIGEVYLEAYQVFKDEQWLERAGFIAQILIHTALDNYTGGKFWLTDNPRITTADLMVGNAGIIHFLLRYLHPGKFGFPMLTA